MNVNLNGKWIFRNIKNDEYMDAIVPGSVYNDLLSNGKTDDPFYRDNEDATLKLSDYDYEYKRSFNIDNLDFNYISLVCDGIDTISEIYINGTLIGKTKNMHRGYEFDIKNNLVMGENEIKIVLFSPTNYVKKKHNEEPLMHTDGIIDGFTHIRKAHYMFGWDWGPKLPDSGIWRDIRIECFNEKINDYYITQTHHENKVILDIDVEATSDNIETEIVSPNGEKYTSKGTKSQIVIENPMLWWHSGYGEQPLYQVIIKLGDEDKKEFKIGLRTLSINTEKDEWGNKFCFNINGKDIFAMGSNYIPEDSILARTNEGKTRKLLTDCVKANHNCIRVWGGGTYLPDYFYRICDELGIIVWQDLMFACGVYNLDEIESEVEEEVKYNVKRLRNYSCIALWCGNNEIEEAWTYWGWEEKYSKQYKADYIKMFEYMIPKLMKKYDPNRFYWPSTPSSGGGFDEPRYENSGDRHYWSVWHGLKPFEDYKKYHFRFLSEFGFQSFPCIKTIKTFAEPEDMNIFSYVMEKHQKNGTANEKILHYLAKEYRYPYSFERLIYLSQLMQAEAMRYGIEHFRRNRKNSRCMGTLYWQTNDCWPVASWAGIDYYGRWKALHYKSKRFFAPVLLSADIEDAKVNLCVVNETKDKFHGKVVWQLAKSDGEIVESDSYDVEVDSLDTSETKTLDFTDYMPDYKASTELVFNYKLLKNNAVLSSECQLFVKSKHFKYKEPELTIAQNNGKLEVTVSAFAQDIELTHRKADVIFSDNYFSLLPNETKVIDADMALDIGDIQVMSVYEPDGAR